MTPQEVLRALADGEKLQQEGMALNEYIKVTGSGLIKCTVVPEGALGCPARSFQLSFLYGFRRYVKPVVRYHFAYTSGGIPQISVPFPDGEAFEAAYPNVANYTRLDWTAEY